MAQKGNKFLKKQPIIINSEAEKEKVMQTEAAILGSVFKDNSLLDSVYSKKLKPDNIYYKSNQIIYSTMLQMLEKNIPIEPKLLFTHLNQGEQKQVGGLDRLLKIKNDSLDAGKQPEKYLSYLLVLYHRRESAALGSSLQDAIQNSDISIENLRDQLSKHLIKLDSINSVPQNTLKFASQEIDALVDQIENSEEFAGIPTGFYMLDNLIEGLRPSDLIVLAGRPAMGKTAFAINIMRKITFTTTPKRVVFFSLEMSTKQILERLLSLDAMVDSRLLRKKRYLSREQWDQINLSSDIIQGTEDYICIDETAALTVSDIRNRVQQLKKNETPADLIIIDYLQLITSKGQFERRDLEVSNITRNLKMIAKDFNLPVLLLSQLNRQVESRKSKIPVLSDLRDSGAIEQDADIVAFIYRDEIYNPKNEEKKNIADIIISKNRSGQIGNAALRFTPKFTRFDNLDFKRKEDV
jgi:replicative DNA helicase